MPSGTSFLLQAGLERVDDGGELLGGAELHDLGAFLGLGAWPGGL
jgi:hypothetical protein